MIDLNFKNSVIISTVLHILLVFFLPRAWFLEDQTDWVEVSVTTFPAEREHIPEDWSLDEPEATPGREFSDRRRMPEEDISVSPPDTDIGLPVEPDEPNLEDIQRETIASPVDDQVSKVVPGREERLGIPREEPGDRPGEILEGPVSRRRVLRRIQPEYPRWAEERGAEGDVKLRFWVSPIGQVTGVEVLQTSGYPNLDSRAMEAMRRYLFEPLGEDEEQEEQWGTIIIRYTLSPR